MESCISYDDLLFFMHRKRRYDEFENCFRSETRKKIKINQSVLLSSLFLREPHEKLHGFMALLERKSNHQFFYQCRLTKNTFGRLLTEIYDHVAFNFSNYGRERINPRASLMMTLWYLGKPTTFTEIAEQLGVTISSVHRHVELVILIINEMHKSSIMWPTADKINKIENEFKSLANFPGVIGSIDGCHIKIKAPEKLQKDYLDRTFNHSVILLAVCDANKKCTYINAGFAGSAHDQRVFSLSSLGKGLEENYKRYCFSDKYHLTGDSAFTLKKRYMMVPFKDYGNLSHKKDTYNTKLSTTRRVIENAFGWLKGRFRRLKYIDADLHRISRTITAACILHNITLESEEEILLLQNEIGIKFEQNKEHNPDLETEIPEPLSGITKREEIVMKL